MGSNILPLQIQAQASGVDEINRLVDAMNRMTGALDKGAKSTTGAAKAATESSTAFAGFADKVKYAVSDPLGAAGNAAQSFLTTLGPAGAIAAAAGAGFIAAGAGVGMLAKSFGDLYEQQSNNAIRLGVSLREYGQLARVSSEAGLSQDALVGTMRGLSKALADTGTEGTAAQDALRRIGVSGTDAFGAVRPMRDVILDIADNLGKVSNPAAKADTAVKVMGRGALEVLPLMNSELRTQIELLERSGSGWNKTSEAVGAATDTAFDALDRKTASIWKNVKGFSAALALAVLDPKAYAKLNRDINAWTPEQLRRNNSELAGRRELVENPNATLSIPDWMLSQQSENFTARMGVTDAQMQAMDATRRKQQVAAIIGDDPQKRLQALKADLDKAVEANDVELVRRLSGEYKALEASIKNAGKAGDALTGFAKSLAQESADPLQKLTLQYQTLLTAMGKVGATAGQLAEAESLYREAGVSLAYGDFRKRNAMAGQRQLPGGIPIEMIAGQAEQFEFAEMMRQNQENVNEAVSSMGGVFGTDPAWLEKSGKEMDRQLATLQEGVQFQARFVELLAGPGGEVAAIRQSTDIRLAALDKQKRLAGESFDLERERNKILEEGSLRILEIEKQRKETRRQEGAQMFDAITAGGGGIQNYLKGLVIGQGRTAFSNLYGALSTGLEGSMSLTGDRNSTLGKILQGTMFGAKPDTAAVKMDLAGVKMSTAGDKMITAAGLMQRAALSGRGAGAGALSAGTGNSGFDDLLSFAVGLGSTSGGALDASQMLSPELSYSPEFLQQFPSLATGSSGASGTSAMKGVGIGSALAAGAFGAYSGFSAGGAQGAMTGTASLAGSAASVMAMAGMTGPAAPILAGVAAVLGAAAMLMGDPKKRRADELSAEYERRKYTEPTGTDYSSDIYGHGVDYNKRGEVRINLTMHVNALDSKSVIDNQEVIGEAVRQAFSSYPPLAVAARDAVMPS